MTVLLIHALSKKSRGIASVYEHEMLLPNNDDINQYCILDARGPVPRSYREFDFAAIVVTSTFMDLITDPSESSRIQQKFEFLKESSAYKIALPQDDYWMSNVRDSWYTEMKFNVVFPVCAPQYWKTLLPTFSQVGSIEQGYTAYIGKRFREMHMNLEQAQKKKFDIVYRSTRNPLYPNSLGNLKGQLGTEFEKIALDIGSELSINVTGKFIKGKRWENFIMSSKSILGSPSGSSTLVRDFEDLKKIRLIMNTYTDSSIDSLKDVLSPDCLGVDYTAISPRNIEAAALGCLQILIPGSYGEILHPHRDYLPLEFSPEGFMLIEETLKSSEKINELTNNCWETLVNHREIQAKNFIDNIQTRIRNHSKGRCIGLLVASMEIPKHTKVELIAQKLFSISRNCRFMLSQVKRFLRSFRRY